MKGAVYARQPQDIFDTKKNSEEPLHSIEDIAINFAYGSHTIQHYDQHAGHYAGDQYNVKGLPGRGVGAENDLMENFFPDAVIFRSLAFQW